MLNAYVATGYAYQWKKNGVAIAGATLSSYTATTSGSYTVDESVGTCTTTICDVFVQTPTDSSTV